MEACSKTAGISSPNINYVNKVLTSWYEEGGKKTASGEVSGADINRYYELLRAKEEREVAQRREEVYSRLPQIREMDEEESRLGASLSRILVSDRIDKKEAIEQIREQIDEMSAQRAFLMTDNGFEFTNRLSWNAFIKEKKTMFENTLEELGLEYKTIKPHTPKQNGRVERSHRKDQERFYYKKVFCSFEDLKNRAKYWIKEYNNFPMRPLGWLSPKEKYLEYINS